MDWQLPDICKTYTVRIGRYSHSVDRQ